MNLSFSPFRKDVELAEQRALFSSAFPENDGLPPETEAFYLKKFRGFPHQPAAYEYVARDLEGMVGYYAAIPFTYRIDGEDFRCGMVCDVMTAPRMQGKGVFTKLGAYSLESLEKEGIDFVTGYPRRAAVIPGHLKVGWKIAFRLPLYIMPLRTNTLLASRGLGMLAPLANLALKVIHVILQFLGPRTEGLYVREWNWKDFLADQDYEVFFQQWRQQQRNSLEKNEAYLRWRLGYQGVDYRIVSAHRGDKLVGLSILRSCRPEGVPSVALMDVMTLESEPAVLSVLVDGWRHLAARAGDEVVLTMMSEYHASCRSLWRFGFLRTPAVFFLILKCLSAKAKDKVLPDTTHWDLMWIDCDDL
jgi:GNAT superfamily N-acetyltransferase